MRLIDIVPECPHRLQFECKFHNSKVHSFHNKCAHLHQCQEYYNRFSTLFNSWKSDLDLCPEPSAYSRGFPHLPEFNS